MLFLSFLVAVCLVSAVTSKYYEGQISSMIPKSLELSAIHKSLRKQGVAAPIATSNLRDVTQNLEVAAPSSFLVYNYYFNSATCGGTAAGYGYSIGLNTCFLYSDSSEPNTRSVKYTQSGSSFNMVEYSDTACTTQTASYSIPSGCTSGTDNGVPMSVSVTSSNGIPVWPSSGFVQT
jgi:hypothetical protein